MAVRSKLLGALAAGVFACLLASAAGAQDDIVTPIGDITPLAEIIGAAHQIRQQCGDGDQSWRDEMLALIDMEARNDDNRQRTLIDAFNAGFRQQEDERLGCGADARAAESALAEQGRRLAEELRDRYLN